MEHLGTQIKENYYYCTLEIKITEYELLQYITFDVILRGYNSNITLIIKLNFIVAYMPENKRH